MRETPKGLHSQHLGLIIDGRVIAPPSQFAFAYVGTRTMKELGQILAGIRDGHEKEDQDPRKLDLSNTPLLEHYLSQDSFDVRDLARMVQADRGSQKMIIRSSILPVNESGQKVTLSSRVQASMLIDSRRLKVKQHPSDPSLYNPFDIRRWEFEGGTQFSRKTLKRGQHWNEGPSHEGAYLRQLGKNPRKQFDTSLQVIDYARASVPIALDDIIRSERFGLISVGEETPIGEIELPFDFSPKQGSFERPMYAIEAFLLEYAPRKVIREVLGHETGDLNLDEIDERLLGKKIVPGSMIEHFESGVIAKGVMISEKSFRGYGWAIIQALEEHFFEKERLFKGYSLEFVDIPGYKTVSIVFDMPPYSQREDAVEEGKKSVRIVFDEQFGLPYILYKVFDPREYNGVGHLGNRKPTGMVNISKSRRWGKARQWRDTDWRTNREALCTLMEPSDDILKRASQLAYDSKFRDISAGELRTRYIRTMQKRKQEEMRI